SLAPVRADLVTVLSVLARAGHGDSADAGRAFHAGISRFSTGKKPLFLLPPADCTFHAFDRALDRLARAVPAVKQRAVDACAHCVLVDGRVTVREAELLRAVCDVMGCPLPPFLPGAGDGGGSSPGPRRVGREG
ncbi:MAG: hypothetical protein ACE5JG_06700, partial [Planctomycetota bacterium]